jgi:DNA-binding MarR family transcriptional regulator
MHRYSITFDAPTIDEIRLRELLEREFRLARVSITRETGSGALPEESKSPSKLEKAILEILSDGQAIRRKQLQNFLGQPPNRRFLDGTLRRLIDRGEVEKVRHGVYIRAGATHPDSSKIPPLNYDAAHPARDRVLKLLSEAHSAVELRTELDVSRQRVEQIVKVLMHEGLVHRIPAPGERGQHLYLRTDIDPNKALLGRQPFLTDVRAKVLSVHSPETIHRARDVSKVRGTSHWAVVKSLKKLSAQGLLYTFKIGQHFYVGLTPRGYEHPQFDLDAPKAQPADLFEDCNKATIWFLQALSVLGPARTIDVTDTLPEGFYGAVGYKSGQVTQRLQMASLIEADSKKSGKQSRYRLTAKGSYTAAVLNRLRRPPSIADLVD